MIDHPYFMFAGKDGDGFHSIQNTRYEDSTVYVTAGFRNVSGRTSGASCRKKRAADRICAWVQRTGVNGVSSALCVWRQVLAVERLRDIPSSSLVVPGDYSAPKIEMTRTSRVRCIGFVARSDVINSSAPAKTALAM